MPPGLNIINNQGEIEPEIPDLKLTDEQLAARVIENGVSLDQLEKLLLEKALKQTDNVVSGAARLLGITRPAMAYRMKKMGLE